MHQSHIVIVICYTVPSLLAELAVQGVAAPAPAPAPAPCCLAMVSGSVYRLQTWQKLGGRALVAQEGTSSRTVVGLGSIRRCKAHL